MALLTPPVGTKTVAALGPKDTPTPVVVLSGLKRVIYKGRVNRWASSEMRLVEVMVAGETKPRRIAAERLDHTPPSV